MVTLTDQGATIIRSLIQRHNLTSAAGLRIAANTTRGTLMFSLVSSPATNDTVIRRDGAVVFLDTAAAQILDGKTLDATVGAEGTPEFSIADQPGVAH